MNRQTIRALMRERRAQLSVEEQQMAAKKINVNISQYLKDKTSQCVGLYLSNDGEIDTHPSIHALWQQNKAVYLPVLHPFTKGYLLFQKYEKNSPMKANRYGILEPKLNCSHICPIEQLDVIFTPLVAFDEAGNRLGMGGGYYDRSLAKYYREERTKPAIVGLAHNCQKVDSLSTESWDVPLDAIITPNKCYLR